MSELELIDNGPCFEPGDNDPINGRFVNAHHKKLLVEHDWMWHRGEKNEAREAEIFAEELEIFKEEAVKNNPLGLFYLGVCYVNGSGLPKDMVKGHDALYRAYKLGVKRAADFLFRYFGGAEAPKRRAICISPKAKPKYCFVCEDAAQVVERILRTEDKKSQIFILASDAINGSAKALFGLYELLKGKDAELFEPAEDAFFCLYEAASLKDVDALHEMGDLSICSDKYRDVVYGVECLWKSSELGNKKAYSSLVDLWANDLKNYTNPEYREEIRAKGEDVFAVGFFYLHGISIEKDLNKAKKYFSLAEKMGCDRARLMLLDIEKGIVQ